jgi:nucleoid DNA-binding protein
MNKSEFIWWVKKSTENMNLTNKVVGQIVDLTFKNMKLSLINERRFHYRGFGTFKVKKMPSRTIYIPFTGVKRKIPSKYKVIFIPSRNLKERL